MPEAEDVITDAARHATVFVQDLWRRHRANPAGTDTATPLLQRLDLLLAGSFGQRFHVRASQPIAPVPLLRRWFARDALPLPRDAIPATDGTSIWLPLDAPAMPVATLQVLALQQAARATRGAPRELTREPDPWIRAVFEILQADAADAQLIQQFPGVTVRVVALRERCLSARPPLDAFPPTYRPLEGWLRDVLRQPPHEAHAAHSSEQALQEAHRLCQQRALTPAAGKPGVHVLFRDHWTGELRAPQEPAEHTTAPALSGEADKNRNVRSARLKRRPDLRKPDARDEDKGSGAWMVQTTQPHEHAEDPFGMQRPSDRDEQTAAEDLAESVSELPAARLVTSARPAQEVLLSDDPPPRSARTTSAAAADETVQRYPEWDWRIGAYRHPGAAVLVREARLGSREWVLHTLERHRALLQAVQRQFESLRAERTRLRHQLDGDELDLQACVDAVADARAGAAIERGLYQSTRSTTRELAVLLLIDVSGSTDSWVSQHRRVIDVEREALLLVCLALDSLAEPYSVLAFSGLSAEGVTVRNIKEFGEPAHEEIGLRIAGLEPELYTRAGAAIRHASQCLMRQPARHRLLLLLSDGKPNDVDEYDGRYGIEDMRQAVVEARLQGIFPFCLTIDRQVAAYLPRVFGEHQYAVLHHPDALPAALLGWLRRLVQR